MSSGVMHWVNYPLAPAPSIDFTDRLVAPLGKSIHLQFFNTEPSLCKCVKLYFNSVLTN